MEAEHSAGLPHVPTESGGICSTCWKAWPCPSAENDVPTRRSVNGHTLELRATYWRCLQCDHRFENAADAEGFWCGDDCTGRHIPPGADPIGTCPDGSRCQAPRECVAARSCTRPK